VGSRDGFQRVGPLRESVSEIRLAGTEGCVGILGPREVVGQYGPGFKRQREMGWGIFRDVASVGGRQAVVGVGGEVDVERNGVYREEREQNFQRLAVHRLMRCHSLSPASAHRSRFGAISV
jgi:hypothetical protein